MLFITPIFFPSIEEGLEIGSVTYEKSESPYGTIIGISPEQGTTLMNGSNIDIIVSSGNGEKSNQVTLIVPLPKNVNNDITIKAINKNNTLIEETINPAAAKYWKPVFQGSGRSVQINVLYNDFLYQTYTIDFSTGSYRLTEDNSMQHE